MVAMPPAGYAGNESEASVTPSGESAEGLIGIDEVQRALNRSCASVYRYTNTDPRNLNPPNLNTSNTKVSSGPMSWPTPREP